MSVHKSRSLPWPAVALLSMWAPVCAGSDLNGSEAAVPLAGEIVSVQIAMLWASSVTLTLVFILMLWFTIQHRKSAAKVGAQVQLGGRAELVWTLIPIFMLIALAIPSTKTSVDIEMSGAAGLTVTVTGYQWQWQFSNADAGFRSVRQRDVSPPIVLPEYKEIRTLTTPITDHLSTVLHGTTGTPMQSFGEQADVAAVQPTAHLNIVSL